ncbi:FxsA family protein [Desulfovibrio sp. OttesenSCG-928-O18]|nr:FxsA family protein [Desulfovibrio sp. OttesenSCG-928-O18]
MLRFTPLLLLLFPALELWVMIQVGSHIGALNTVALVFLSILIGIGLLRLRGVQVAKNMRAEIEQGRIPSNPLVDTFCIMIAGCLFIFPGFISDIIALLLIIPGVRYLLMALAVRKMKTQGFQSQTVHFQSSSSDSGQATWTCTTFGTGSAGSTGGERYAPDLERRGSTVVIDCEPELIEAGTDEAETTDVTPTGPDGPDGPGEPEKRG